MGRSIATASVVAVVLLLGAFFVYRGLVTEKAPVVDPIAARTDAGPIVTSTGSGGTAGDTVDAGPAVLDHAEIVAARGAIQVRGADGKWVDAAPGQRLNTDDAVRAGRNAEATLRMGNGVEVRLSPRSEFTIRELSESVSKIRLEEGHVTASVDEKGNRVLKVGARGTDAEAESTGGQFGVVTDGKGQLAVATTTGSVKLSAGGATVEVGAGETSSVAGGAPSAPRPIPASLFLKVGELGNQKTNQTSVTVTGQTDPGTLVKAGDTVARVDDKGRFKVQVQLKDGENKLAVEVVDATGRSKVQSVGSVVVDREKPKIEAETTWGGKTP
jgi:hypothetical protein